MMNRRTLILALAAAVLIGVLGVVVTLLRKPQATTNTNIPLVISNTNQAVAPEDSERERNAAAIRSAAVIVSEAWASGPTGESNQRLLAAKDSLTENLRTFAVARASVPQTKPDPEKLEAARALTEKITEQTTDRASVEVTLQVSTTTVPTPPTAGSPEVTYRKLKLGFQKVGEAWKVFEVTDLGRVEL